MDNEEKLTVKQALRIGSVVCRFYHPAVGSGDFVKRFVRPIYGEAIIIRLENGREWVAPSWEFTFVS